MERFGLDRSRKEAGSMGIVSAKNDRELQGVDPALSPVNFWLYSCKPGVSKDCLLFA